MSIAKVDVDVRMGEALLKAFIETRLAIIRECGLVCVAHNHRLTEKGHHFWFRIGTRLSEKELCKLQFLLGDDQVRCRFNFLRLDLGAFTDFNALFSRKLKNKQK